jgi:cytochrome P450
MQVHLDVREYFLAQLALRRTRPGEDLISLLIRSRVDGRPLTENELLLYCMMLMAAASQTTQSLIGACLHLAAEDTTLWEALREDRSRIPAAVEEVLRWWTPVRSMARTAAIDTELGGEEIRAGDGLLLLYQAANRDEAVWGDDGERFDPSRNARMRHLSFGHGEHLCMGHVLARLEPALVFEELLDRFDGVAAAGEPTYHPSTVMNGFEKLPLVFR